MFIRPGERLIPKRRLRLLFLAVYLTDNYTFKVAESTLFQGSETTQ